VFALRRLRIASGKHKVRPDKTARKKIMSTAAPTQPQKHGLDVPRALGKCAVCGRSIEGGERLFAAVRETPTGLERLDIAPEHWEAFDKSHLLGFWQTVMPAAEQKKKVFVDDEVLCTLFERLADATETAKLNFRFVLALVLMRKRLIIYEETRKEEGHDVWVVRLKGREDRRLDRYEGYEGKQQLRHERQRRHLDLGQLRPPSADGEQHAARRDGRLPRPRLGTRHEGQRPAAEFVKSTPLF